MTIDLNCFDYFVDDLLESDENLLKGELDILLMQHIFKSIDLSILDKIPAEKESYIAA